MSTNNDITEEIRQLGLDTLSAQKRAQKGEIEDWAHEFLCSGKGNDTNPAFSESLKREKRWWNGPIVVDLAELSPAVGDQPRLAYVVSKEDWHLWTSNLAKTFTTLEALPPLIVEYRAGELSIRDGNTRYGAMQLLGWPTCWIVIWYNTEADFLEHGRQLKI